MKKLLFPILLLLCLSSCQEDLSGYFDRLNLREDANEKLKEENDNLREQNAAQQLANDAQAKRNAAIEEMNNRLKLESDELRTMLADLEASFGVTIHHPKLLGIEFVTDDNPTLTENVRCEIIGDSLVECWLPIVPADKYLIPRFTFEGTLVTIDEMEAQSGESMFDFKTPVTLTVHTSESSASYKMYVHSFTGLPVIRIDTEGGAPILTKTDYVNAHMTMTEDVRTRGAGDVLEADLRIRGRGNSTWDIWPKKPYRMKFNEKVSFFGEHKNKDWVLLANYADKTSLRNHVASYLGKLSNLDYTPCSHFVDLILNGSYDGTYELSEKIEISNDRVAVGDEGFLLEVDRRAPTSEKDSIYINVAHMESAIVIKEPEVMIDDEDYQYVEARVAAADYVLYSPGFKDPDTGWTAYLDMDSFVDWYLINEIAHNPDATMFTSCYMNLRRDGKIKMGPIWDFDLAFGNTDYWQRGPEKFWIKQSDWISRMFKDPAFVARVKERYDYFYSRKFDILREIDETASYLKRSALENENRWHTLYQYTLPNYDIWGSYLNEVQSIKEWLVQRMDWLKKEFDKM